mmetsp:Transcript_1207/g.3407  ORF Transcript_1207/g.3407 Transcript_1207/m.3407 type:complete len:272 (-) Transcript_1207:627-1442(-)
MRLHRRTKDEDNGQGPSQPLPSSLQQACLFAIGQSVCQFSKPSLQSNLYSIDVYCGTSGTGVGHPLPPFLQHQACFDGDQWDCQMLNPSSQSKRTGLFVVVSVSQQPLLSFSQHQVCCAMDHSTRQCFNFAWQSKGGLVVVPSCAVVVVLTCSTTVASQPLPPCLQHHVFFASDQTAVQSATATPQSNLKSSSSLSSCVALDELPSGMTSSPSMALQALPDFWQHHTCCATDHVPHSASSPLHSKTSFEAASSVVVVAAWVVVVLRLQATP